MDYNFGIEPGLKNLTPFRSAFKDQYGRAATIDETRNWLGLKPIDEFRAENPNYLPPSMQGVPNARATAFSPPGQTAETQTGGAVRNLFDGINAVRNGLNSIGSGTTQNTITMPSMSNENVPGWINDLSQGIPNFFQAYENYQGLPGKIDEWTQNAVNRQRATGEQVAGIFNQMANQRAGSGIMGGTEQSNALAQMLTNLARIYSDNKTNIEMTGAGMKANAISGLPSAAMLPISAMSSLYGQNAADQQNWASLAANILNTGY